MEVPSLARPGPWMNQGWQSPLLSLARSGPSLARPGNQKSGKLKTAYRSTIVLVLDSRCSFDYDYNHNRNCIDCQVLVIRYWPNNSGLAFCQYNYSTKLYKNIMGRHILCRHLNSSPSTFNFSTPQHFSHLLISQSSLEKAKSTVYFSFFTSSLTLLSLPLSSIK